MKNKKVGKLMNENMIIDRIEHPDKKAQIVSEVLADLPEWFGLPESTKSYVEEARELPLWVARNKNDILGFVTLRESSPDTGDLHCMGIKKSYHRKGIGTQLFHALETFSKENYKFIQVKTVDEGHYAEYDQTIAFYQSVGFSKLEVFPDMWDEWNPCLIMVKAL